MIMSLHLVVNDFSENTIQKSSSTDSCKYFFAQSTGYVAVDFYARKIIRDTFFALASE